MRTFAALALIIVFTGTSTCFSQTDSAAASGNRVRKTVFISTTSLFAGSGLVALNQAWYKDYRTSQFHFFNDNAEWLQMDKVGHFYTTYQMADLMMNAFERVGYSRWQTHYIGGGMGLAFMSVIEVMDGYSSGWGFSWGDELADILGTSLAVGQRIAWKEQRFRIKFSYAESGLASYRPDVLGNNFPSRLLKDYNGQTYWLSFNPFAFTRQKPRFFPSWLSLSLGYSAYGMLGGFSNPVLAVDRNGNALTLERQRRFYLSLDVDLTKIKTKSKWLRKVLGAVNMLKFPAPALQLQNGKAKFYYLYY